MQRPGPEDHCGLTLASSSAQNHENSKIQIQYLRVANGLQCQHGVEWRVFQPPWQWGSQPPEQGWLPPSFPFHYQMAKVANPSDQPQFQSPEVGNFKKSHSFHYLILLRKNSPGDGRLNYSFTAAPLATTFQASVVIDQPRKLLVCCCMEFHL